MMPTLSLWLLSGACLIRAGVVWQVGNWARWTLEAATVAQYLACYGMEVVDCGVAVLSMHSPFEIVSKADIYMAYQAYRVFMEKNELSQPTA